MRDPPEGHAQFFLILLKRTSFRFISWSEADLPVRV